MKIRELMSGPPLTVRDSEDVALALQILAWSDVRHLPVLRDGRLVGVVSERDLLASREANPAVREVMTSPAQVADVDEDVSTAAARMLGARLGCLPVLERGHLVGIVTTTDLVRLEATGSRAEELRGPVTSVMTRAPMTVRPGELLLHAIAAMSERQIRHAPVVDEMDRLVGMLSDRDVRLALGATLFPDRDGAATERVRWLTVRDAMAAEPALVHESASLGEAATAILREQVGALPVIDERRHVVGIVSYVDILRALAQRQASSASESAIA